MFTRPEPSTRDAPSAPNTWDASSDPNGSAAALRSAPEVTGCARRSRKLQPKLPPRQPPSRRPPHQPPRPPLRRPLRRQPRPQPRRPPPRRLDPHPAARTPSSRHAEEKAKSSETDPPSGLAKPAAKLVLHASLSPSGTTFARNPPADWSERFLTLADVCPSVPGTKAWTHLITSL